VDARLWTRLGSRYRSGRSKDWLKFKNPNAPAVKREGEGDWGREPVAVKKAKKTHKTGGVIVWIVIVLLTYLAIPIPFAAAQEIWTCTWPGFSQDRSPVIQRYRQQGELLVVDHETWREEYRILENNQFGLVATRSISEIESHSTSKEPSIGTRTIVIDKRTGELLWSNLFSGSRIASTRQFTEPASGASTSLAARAVQRVTFRALVSKGVQGRLGVSGVELRDHAHPARA
jgi:hypothetical protein